MVYCSYLPENRTIIGIYTMVPVLQNIKFASRGLSNSLRCFKVEKEVVLASF